MGGLHLLYLAIRGEVQFVDANLSVEAMRGLWDVVAMVDDVVFVAVLQDAMMAGAMNGAVVVGFEDATLVFIGAHRSNGARGILHTIGVVVAGTRGIGEVIDAVALQHEGSLEEILDLGIQDEFLIGKRLHVGIELRHTASEAIVDAPCAEIDIDLTVVVDEGLTVEGDGIMNKAVLHKDGVVAAQYVLPRAERRRPYALVQNAWLTVEVAIEAVGSLHHVGCPHHLGRRPVHDVIGPRAEVL